MDRSKTRSRSVLARRGRREVLRRGRGSRSRTPRGWLRSRERKGTKVGDLRHKLTRMEMLEKWLEDQRRDVKKQAEKCEKLEMKMFKKGDKEEVKFLQITKPGNKSQIEFLMKLKSNLDWANDKID